MAKVDPEAIRKGLKATAEIISTATAVLGAANTLKDTVQPAIDSDEGKAVIGKGKEAVGGLFQKAGETKDVVGGVIGKAADTKAKYADARKAKKEERELAKQLKQARQMVLEGASQRVTYKEFARLKDQEGSGIQALATGLYSGSGWFVITTYSTIDFDKDLTDYLGIYVGKGNPLGKAIEYSCSRDGDPDVYADVKYKQNVQIYFYPCNESEVEEQFKALYDLFYSETDKE